MLSNKKNSKAQFLFFIKFIYWSSKSHINVLQSNFLKSQGKEDMIKHKLLSDRMKQLNYTSELERYAREEKLFKKDDEDIFIISNE